MLESEAFREFKQGLERLRDGAPEQGLEHFRRAVALESHNPYYLSYLGLAMARAEQKWAEAETLCQAAVQMQRNHPQLYLNLAEVYTKAGRREDAVATLTRGLQNARRDQRLNQTLSKLVIRRPPVLAFLPRSSFLNRQLGKLRQRALEYFGAASRPLVGLERR